MTTSPVQANRLQIEIAPRTLGLVLAAIVGIWMLGRLAGVVEVVVVALVLVGTFDPGVAWCERRGLRRGRALVLVFGLGVVGFVAFVLLMVPPLIEQLLRMVETAPATRTQLVHDLRAYPWAKPLVGAIKDLPLDSLAARAGAAMLGYSTTLFEAIGYGISTMVLAIYLLADPAHAKGLVYSVVPRHHHIKLARILFGLRVIVGGYIRGQLITSAAITVFVFALLTIVGADNAIPIALFAGMTDILPFVGGYIASAPVILAVTPHGGSVVVIVAVVMLLYQEFESRILVPRVYGHVLRMSPAVVLVALLVGGTLAGIVGALLALPIAAGLQMVVHELRVDLPGDMPTTDATHLLDERANMVYEHLSETATTAAAGVIADDIATMVKRTENADE
ncbi:MAG: AI-2E family transporter [Proteobacteria bacterium]|nr:AI-2E family transporter [Pseudomonadota bacterium]